MRLLCIMCGLRPLTYGENRRIDEILHFPGNKITNCYNMSLCSYEMNTV